jgi:hypothetical protein
LAGRDDTRRRTRIPRLIERVIQQRRNAKEGNQSLARAAPGKSESEDPVAERVADVERRLERLESLVEGLQDSVYRESLRQQRQIDELRRGRTS